MKERPILFSAPMVRALLSGAKTQTRRVVKIPRGFDFTGGQGDDLNDPANWGGEDENGNWWALASGPLVDHVLPCPYGQPGDRLWVRETFGFHHFDETPISTTPIPVFAADGPKPDTVPRWRPSIHMTRWASRIDLEVTGVRVERLQDISEADARAEGYAHHGDRVDQMAPSSWFSGLWESINGPGSWDANPWVWVVEFQRVK